MADNSIDFVVTDPPYGLKFMNKKWDKEIPGVEIWKETLRVCKPGSMLAAFGGSRTHHHLMMSLEGAGFCIVDVCMFLHGMGFPKAHSFGRKLGGKWEGYASCGLKPAYEPIIICQKPLDGTYAQNAEKWGVGGINIDKCRIKTNDVLSIGCYSETANKLNYFSSIRNGLGMEKYQKRSGRWPANIILDEAAGEMLDEMSGISNSKRSNRGRGFSSSGSNDGYKRKSHNNPEFQNILGGYDDQGGASRFFFIARKEACDIMESCASVKGLSLPGKKMVNEDNSQNIDLSGNRPTGLFQPDTISIIKMETHSIIIFPILSVSKLTLIGIFTLECEKNINELEMLNIESVSIAENGESLIYFQNEQKEPIKAIAKNVAKNACLNGEKIIESTGTNITGKEEKIQETNTIKNILKKTEKKLMLEEERDTKKEKSQNNRFFYTAKASQAERNRGCEELDVKDLSGCYGEFKGDGRGRQKEHQPTKNNHLTVKPISLMKYIITLLAPPGNPVLLDPFCGSGSTLVAAIELGIESIGIEMNAEYCEIARCRTSYHQREKDKEESQTTFNFTENSFYTDENQGSISIKQ